MTKKHKDCPHCGGTAGMKNAWNETCVCFLCGTRGYVSKNLETAYLLLKHEDGTAPSSNEIYQLKKDFSAQRQKNRRRSK